MAIAKAAVAIVGVVGVATATSLALVSSSPQPMPKWEALSAESAASTTYTNGMYGNTYGKLLVGTEKDENKGWWEWSFKNRYSSNEAKGKFKVVDKATEGDKSLKAICKLAYAEQKTDSGKVVASNTVDNDANKDKFWENNIWLFCSPAKEKITTIQDESDSYENTSSYGGTTTYKTSLVSVKEGKNAWFWEWKQEELIKATDLTGDHVFKKLRDKLKGVNAGDATVKSTLRETCKEAYGKNTGTDATNYPKAEVGKFCSLSGTALS